MTKKVHELQCGDRISLDNEIVTVLTVEVSESGKTAKLYYDNVTGTAQVKRLNANTVVVEAPEATPEPEQHTGNVVSLASFRKPVEAEPDPDKEQYEQYIALVNEELAAAQAFFLKYVLEMPPTLVAANTEAIEKIKRAKATLQESYELQFVRNKQDSKKPPCIRRD